MSDYQPYLRLSWEQTPRMFATWALAFHWPEIQNILPDAEQVNGLCPEWMNYVAAGTARATELARRWGYQPGQAANLKTPLNIYYSDTWRPDQVRFDLMSNNDLTTFKEGDVLDLLEGELFDPGWIYKILTEIQAGAGIYFSTDNLDESIYGKRPYVLTYHEFDYALDPKGHIYFGQIPNAPPSPFDPQGRPGGWQEWILGAADMYLIVPSNIAQKFPVLTWGNVSSLLTVSGKYGPESIWGNVVEGQSPDVPPEEVIAYPPVAWAGQFVKAYVWLSQLLSQMQQQTPGVSRFMRVPADSRIDSSLYGYGFPDPVTTFWENVLTTNKPEEFVKTTTQRQRAAMYATRLHDFYKRLGTTIPDEPRFKAPASGYNLYQKPFMSNYIDVGDLP